MDGFITQQTAIKAHATLYKLERTLTDIYFAKRWAETALKTVETETRTSRVKRWKTRIRDFFQTWALVHFPTPDKQAARRATKPRG